MSKDLSCRRQSFHLRRVSRYFLATATGFGTVGARDGKPFFDVKSGKIDIGRIEYREKN